MATQDSIFRKISEALLTDYSSIYYVNAVTNAYFWYSVNPEFHSLNLEQGGDDFFRNIIRDCKKVVYEEDQHIFIEDIQKDNLLSAMSKGSMQNIKYRLMINGVPVWHSLRMIRGLDENADYFILGVINIDDEYRRREAENLLGGRVFRVIRTIAHEKRHIRRARGVCRGGHECGCPRFSHVKTTT